MVATKKRDASNKNRHLERLFKGLGATTRFSDLSAAERRKIERLFPD